MLRIEDLLQEVNIVYNVLNTPTNLIIIYEYYAGQVY